ncbi:MAG: hypothetical protein OXB84_01625 [Halobacteriovoraceae bacterium]|nr:hypothetical protein [Halobacteriovoraceae bacterium]
MKKSTGENKYFRSFIPSLVLPVCLLVATVDTYAEEFPIPRDILLRGLESSDGQRVFSALSGRDYFHFNSDDERINRFVLEFEKINNKELETAIAYFFSLISNNLQIRDRDVARIMNSFVEVDEIVQSIYMLKIGRIVFSLEDRAEKENIRDVILHFGLKFENAETLYLIIRQILIALDSCESQVADLLTSNEQYEDSPSGVYAGELGLNGNIIIDGFIDPNGRRIYEVLKGEKIQPPLSEHDVSDFIRAFNGLQNDVLAWEIRNAFFEMSNAQKNKYIRRDQDIDDLLCSINRFKIWKIKRQMNENASNIDLLSLAGRLMRVRNPQALVSILENLKTLTVDQIVNLLNKISFLKNNPRRPPSF